MGIVYTDAELQMMEKAKREAVKFMKRYFAKPKTKLELLRERIISRAERLQEQYDSQLRMYSDGFEYNELPEFLQMTVKQLNKAIESGTLRRERVPHTRGGKYSYNAEDVLKLHYARQYAFTPNVFKTKPDKENELTQNDTQ
jgi:hypothetical protein